MVYTLINHGFLTNQSATPGPMYIISKYDNETHKRRKTKKNQKRLRNQTKTPQTPRNQSFPPFSTNLACDTASVAGQLAKFVEDGGKDGFGIFGAVEYITCCFIVNSVNVLCKVLFPAAENDP